MTELNGSSSASLAESFPLEKAEPAWHRAFLEMLPKIEEYAQYWFRHLQGDDRDEAVQAVSANACQAYARLVERGCADQATWSSLTKFAIRQVQSGRRVGSSLNVRDVTSRHCQLKKQLRVQNLYAWDDEAQEWTEMIVEDRHQTPADLAAFRIDFRAFLRSLSRRNCRIALRMAQGHSTRWIAKTFQLSSGRISQLRRELADAWQQFHAEPAAGQTVLQEA